MNNNFIDHFKAGRFLFLFILIHLIGWTLIPILFRHNLPLDAIEGTIWGHQLELGYDKNPFMNAWLTALATYLGGYSGWMIYLFSQISVILCFWAVFRLASQMLPRTYALLSVLVLEGIQYYNFHAIDFNDNTLELSLWALGTYFFYKALRSNSTRSWMFTGLFLSLGMMAKYYTAALIACMALFLILYPENRKRLSTIPPYIGLTLFLVVMLPHIIWLFYNNFITVTYVIERTSSEPNLLNHINFPFQFAYEQFQVFIPALILFCLLFIGKKPIFNTETKVSSYDKAFLLFVGMGPFLSTLMLSFLFGIRLRAGWGMPLMSFWGVILFSYIQPRISLIKMKRFILLIFTLLATLLSAYAFSHCYHDTSSANYPGKKIANLITDIWHKQFNTKLNYVGGTRWIAGNIEFYSIDHPSVYIEGEKRLSPWINQKDLLKNGAIFVWDYDKSEKIPAKIKSQFPNLKEQSKLTFFYEPQSNKESEINIGIAILPPS